MTDNSMLKYQYDTILDQLILLQLHAESPDCPCSLKGTHPGELGEFCEPKHLRSIVALARETIAMESDEARLDYLENLVLEGSELLGKMGDKLCDKEVDLGDYVTWSRDKRKPLEGFCYSGFCNITPEEAIVEAGTRTFDKDNGSYFYPEFKPEPTFVHVGPGLKGIIPQELLSTKVQTKLVRSRAYDPAKAPVITRPEDLQQYFRLMRNADQEWLLAIYANQRSHVVGADEISIGEKFGTLLSLDTVFRSAILLNASKIFLAHNHPSGDPHPSEDDIKTFQNMSTFCPMLNITVEDFFVVGLKEDYSIRGERIIPAPAPLEDIARMFRKKAEPRWCFPVKETDKELGKLSRTLGTAKKRIAEIQRHLEIPLNICRGQAEMFESTTGVLDPYGSRCRDPGTGQWVYSEECGFEPAGITTTALGMDGLTRYEFEFKIVSLDKLVVSHDPFTFTPNPNYPKELQPRLRERAATKIQVDKIAANLEPDAVITDFHVIDRGTPIVGPDLVVEAGNGRVMGIIKAAADHPDKYAEYKDRLRERARDYGLSAKDVDLIENPVLIRVRITDVDRTTFTQEANQAATIAPSAIENARTDAQKITLGMLAELIVGENESLEDALRAPKNQAFAKRFLATLPENVQAALVDAQGYLNRDGVHRMAMAVFVSAFQGDPGLRLAEKAFESVDMDVRNTVNAIARSLGTMAQAEALTRTGERDTALSIGDDLAQTINVYSAIKRNPALTVEKYMAQEQIFARELTPFQERILVILEEYKRSPRKLAGIFTAYAEGVIKAPPPAQAALFPGAEITKEGLWESAVQAPEAQPALMEVIRMFESTEHKMGELDFQGLVNRMALRLCTYAEGYEVADDPSVKAKYSELASELHYLLINTKILPTSPSVKEVRECLRKMPQFVIVDEGDGDADSCKEISLMLKGQPWGTESMLAWAERLKVQADRADGCRSLQEAAYTKAYEVIKIAQPMLKPAKVGVAEVARLFAPMKLLTKEIRGKLPSLYSQEKVEDPTVWVKFFTPDSNWTWYGIEFDGEDRFFGWVVGFEKELGYFSLSELESARGPLGLAIERDKWFKPMPLSEVKKLHAHERGELGDEKSSAGFPLDPRVPMDINRFYFWIDKTTSDRLLTELCERADYLGAHLCLAKEGDDVDKEWIEKCPYIGTEEVYSELGRLRFLCWKLTDKLPSSVTILGPAQARAGLAQGTMGAIGAATITGIGIGAGFKLVDWLAKTFTKKEVKEGEMANTEHFCLSGDAWFELQDAIGKGEKQKAMEIMWSKGMKLVLAPMTEEGARQVPAYVDVFKTTIAKHYRPPEDFYDGSIRVVKPEEDILVYLGCLKSDDWDAEAERCSPNPTVLKTIVPNNKKYRDELDHLKLVHPEVKINYQTKEVGVEPVVGEEEQRELEAVGKALDNAEVF